MSDCWQDLLGDGPVTVGHTLTHVAIPVADAIEARRVLIVHTGQWALGTSEFAELTRIADLILPEVLADAAEAQATPAVKCATVLRYMVGLWDKGYSIEPTGAVVRMARAALDAEGAK
jgi:hypothetical protein